MATEPSAEQLKALQKRLAGRGKRRRRLWKRAALVIGTALTEGIVRLLEITVALCVTLLLLLPLLLGRLAVRLPAGKPVFDKKRITGYKCNPVTVLHFSGMSGRLARLPLFLELFTGRLALAGTSIREWQPASPDVAQAGISMVKPGIVSL